MKGRGRHCENAPECGSEGTEEPQKNKIRIKKWLSEKDQTDYRGVAEKGQRVWNMAKNAYACKETDGRIDQPKRYK